MLPYPVTFVCRLPDGFPDLLERENDVPDPDCLRPYPDSEVAWILRTYLALKQKGLNVAISPRLVPGKICVLVPFMFGMRQLRIDCFLVGCRSDFPRPVMCDVAIVQNLANVESDRDIFMPHWPQPGLIPRLPERGSRIENMSFKGRSFNLAPAFRSTEFLTELEALGVHFEVDDESRDTATGWSDYRTSDLILAVRSSRKEMPS